MQFTLTYTGRYELPEDCPSEDSVFLTESFAVELEDDGGDWFYRISIGKDVYFSDVGFASAAEAAQAAISTFRKAAHEQATDAADAIEDGIYGSYDQQVNQYYKSTRGC